MLAISDLTFTVLDVNVPLGSILILFLLVAILAAGIYILIFFSKGKKTFYKNEQVDDKEFKRLEKFEDLRNDFERELGQIKKIRRQKNK